MNVAEGLILGLVQGLTEFLPISSSGHLVLAEDLLGVRTTGLTLEIFLHLGTMMSIIIAFRADIGRLIKGTLSGIIRLPAEGLHRVYRENDGFRLFCLMVIGSLPAAAVGFTLADTVESAFKNPSLVFLMLILTGIVLVSARYASGKNGGNGPRRSFLIGIAQAFALIPGISRSGTTIVAALHLGLSPREAGLFSFMLALPAIFGASLVEAGSILSGGTSIEFWPIMTGTVAAFASGYLAIRWVMRLLDSGKFPYFAVYLWTVGILGVIVRLF
ncbi:undecaprenyl-diphosphate phosphatase [candidate division KSB1 bacterium]